MHNAFAIGLCTGFAIVAASERKWVTCLLQVTLAGINVPFVVGAA